MLVRILFRFFQNNPIKHQFNPLALSKELIL